MAGEQLLEGRLGQVPVVKAVISATLMWNQASASRASALHHSSIHPFIRAPSDPSWSLLPCRLRT